MPDSMNHEIRTVEDLREHLQAAVQLELSVIPPYLCAMYTLRPGRNDEPAAIIRSVVVEEMLHMVLASNVLNAVGGTPRFANEHDAPRYPAYLPDGEKRFEVHLEPFCVDAIDTFLKIEEPSLPHTPPVRAGLAAHKAPQPLKMLRWSYDTVGDFYSAIIRGLARLAAELGETELFSGDPARQVTPEYYYAGGGTPVVVHDLATATAALSEIVEQGEGECDRKGQGEAGCIYDEDGDLAHFFRFMEIRYDRRYEHARLRAWKPVAVQGPEGAKTARWPKPTGAPLGVDWDAVYPMLRDPRGDDYPEGSEVRAASDAFNRTWSRLLRELEAALTGTPKLLLDAVGTMFELKYAIIDLVRNPVPGHPGVNAGPSFEYVAAAPGEASGASAANGSARRAR